MMPGKPFTFATKDRKNVFSLAGNPVASSVLTEMFIVPFIKQLSGIEKYENDIIKSFGGIGVIIGHEIVHGFDNKGRLFDENGNLNNWWQPNDNERYCNLVNKLIDQYNSYKIHDEFINGKLTLGENIADLGGVNFALKGLELYKNLSNEDYKIFFKNYAFIWAINIRKEKELHNLLSDPHAPNIFRVNGILKNINKFYEIYKIKDGDMYLNPEDRIKIW
jgi:predicted metalloendopeptidase